jgi:hypothetical protein
MSECDEIVARTPQVLVSSGRERDYTHLQHCGRPAGKDGKCARHAAKPNTFLYGRWRAFMRRQG